MRSHVLLAFFLVAGFQGLAQVPAAPQQSLPKDPRAILAAAAPFYDFSDPALKPFHLKATYQLYDVNGKPTEQGTFEYWRASPKVYRSTWTRSGAMRTSWNLADGSTASLSSGEPLRYFETQLGSDLMSPLPSASIQDPEKNRAILRDVKFGSRTLPCIYLVPKASELPGAIAWAPTYCFEDKIPALRVIVSNSGTLETTFDALKLFQGRFLAGKVSVGTGAQVLFLATLENANGIDASDPNLIPSQGASRSLPPVTMASEGANSMLFRKQRPIYPLYAKQNGIQGSVLIEAIIGTDGKIKQEQVLASPAKVLSDSSLQCVSQWEYRPYLVNGVPQEVDTLITVIYTLGR
jgi:TonB family protein